MLEQELEQKEDSYTKNTARWNSVYRIFSYQAKTEYPSVTNKSSCHDEKFSFVGRYCVSVSTLLCVMGTTFKIKNFCPIPFLINDKVFLS